ncbi:MAG: hypothetical protein II685_04975 [Clostridia bacterium]|nr:hypothetical protein [Clostridia bacterium]
MMLDKAIYDIIKENLVDDELPESFSLASYYEPQTGDKSVEVQYFDGAFDGITLYHIGRSHVSEDSLLLIDQLMHEVSDGDLDAAFLTLELFSETNSAIGSIDEFEGYIMDNTDWIDPVNLYNFATECLTGADVELVKFGFEIMEIFSEPSDGMKDFMRTLGLCEEFTLFLLFNIITNWRNANSEIFAIAKKTHGWGRIHAVERLIPDDDEIKNWMIFEGIKNNVMSGYSAVPVFRRTDMAQMLKGDLSNKEFAAISAVIFSLLDEGPVEGIGIVHGAEEILSDYLDQASQHRYSVDILKTVYYIVEDIDYDKRFEALKEKCDAILKSEPSKRLIRKELRNGRAFALAKYLNIYNPEQIYEQMVKDFDKNFHNCGLLVKDSFYRSKVLKLFREKLPLEKMANESQQNYGLGEEYKDYTALVMLISELMPFPMEGVDFIKLGLISPIANNKSMALKVLESWCRITGCTLYELSPELAEIVAPFKEKSRFDSSKELFDNLGI